MKKIKLKEKLFSEQTGFYLTCFSLILLVCSILIFVFLGNWKFSKILCEEKVAQFGDFVGGFIGSLFALTGVILYYVALKEQRKDISLNRQALQLQIEALHQQVEEFKAQKEELKETRKVYEEQTALFREQTEYYKNQTKEYRLQTRLNTIGYFDSSFFSLLHLLTTIIQDLNNKKKYFVEIYESLKENTTKMDIKTACNCITSKYEKLYQEESEDLLPFFKTIYRILIFIDSESGQEIDRNKYAKILRSQLTDRELLVLHYDYHSIYGIGARTLATKYKLLKDIKLLDKIEMGGLNFKERDRLSLYFEKIREVIDNNIVKFNDISESDDNINVNEKYQFLDYESSFKLIINDDLFIFSVIFELNDWKKITINYPDQILKILYERFLYDIFFLSKYKIPLGNEIERSTTEFEKTNLIEIKFQIKTTIIL